MGSDHLWQIVMFILFVSMSAIFSAAETAFRSISPTRLVQSFDEGRSKLKTGISLMKKPERLRGVLVIGDSSFNIAAVVLATLSFESLWPGLSPFVFLVLLIALILVLGEMIPKSIGSLYPEGCIAKLSWIVNLSAYIFYPLVQLLLWASDVFLLIIGGNPDKNKPFITEEELMSYVNASHADGVLEVEEREMIVNVVEFGDIEVSQIMIPRIDMISAPIDATHAELYELFRQESFTRIPIYEDNKDHIVGILNIKNWMFFEGDPENYRVGDYMRQAFFTYESKKTSELLTEMRQAKHQMAIVMDEYGGTAGIVTLEDLIEEIVGEIDDEFDEEDTTIKQVGEGVYTVEGSTHIEDVNDRLGLRLESEDFDSIGGFVIGLFGKLPELDESVTWENLKFTVKSVQRNRIGDIELCIFTSEDDTMIEDSETFEEDQ